MINCLLYHRSDPVVIRRVLRMALDPYTVTDLKSLRMKQLQSYKETPKDKGYSWVILLACFLMYGLTVGTVKTFGVLYPELMKYYDSGSGKTASILSICCSIQAFLGPIANTLSVSCSFRAVSLTGSILISIGFFTSAFATNIDMLFVTYSAIIGLGYGLTFVPCTTILNFYFEKNRALANGIVFAGSGIGGFLLPFLYRFLLNEYGLQGTLMVLSGVMLHCAVAAVLFRQPIELQHVKQSEKCAGENNSNLNISDRSQICFSVRKTLTTVFTFRWSLLTDPLFAFVILAFSLACAGYDSNTFVIPALVVNKGFGTNAVALSMSIIGILEVFSRIFFGWFIDRKIISAHTIFTVNMFISGMSSACLPFFNSIQLMYIYSAIVGIFPGSLYTLIPTIIISVVGLDNLPPALGLFAVFIALGSGITQPSIGWLKDISGSWNISNFCIGALLITSALIVFSVHLKLKRKTTKDGDLEDDSLEKDTML